MNKHTSDAGFALPLAMGVGLIALVLGITMISRSQGDRTRSWSRASTAQSLSAAEAGVARYQSLINKYRTTALYPACEDWDASDNNPPEDCEKGTDPSWKNATLIPGIKNACTDTNGTEEVPSNATRGWQPIDPGDASKGEYRLIDYIYASDSAAAHEAPGTGTLTVEGRVNQAQGNPAVTRLKVQFAVESESPTGPVPGLWVEGEPQQLSNNMVNGNILASSCTLPVGVSQSNVTSGHTAFANPNAVMPDTPPLPTTNLYTVSGTNTTDLWGQTLPKAGQQPQPDGTYAYLVDGDLSRNAANISVQSGARIALYVRGNIDIKGNTNINNNGTAGQMQIYGNTFQRNSDGTIKVDSQRRPLTKYGCASTLPVIGSSSATPPASNVTHPTQPYTGACPTTSVSISGSGSIKALVHAPDGVGAVSGGGGNCGTTTGFMGALWFRKWVASSSTSNQVVCAQGSYGDFLATQMTAPPALSRVTLWQREQAAP